MTKHIPITDQVAFWRMKFIATLGHSTRDIPMLAQSDHLYDRDIKVIYKVK